MACGGHWNENFENKSLKPPLAIAFRMDVLNTDFTVD